MNESAWSVCKSFPSDVPLVSDLLERSGERRLRRAIDPQFAASGTAWPDFVEEVQAAALIGGDHPTLSGALAWEERPVPWLAREFAPETLRRYLLAPLAAEVVLSLAVWLLRALRDLHSLGLVHGDPSAGNVLVRRDGTLRLADPISSRRRFPLPHGAARRETEQESDLRRVPAFLRKHVASQPGPGGSAVAHEILLALDRPGGLEPRLSSLERLASSLGVGSTPEMDQVPGPCPSAAPLSVTIAVPRTEDDRIAYEAAKLLSEMSGASVSSLRLELRRRGWSGLFSFPQPARRITAQFENCGLNVRVQRVPAGRS